MKFGNQSSYSTVPLTLVKILPLVVGTGPGRTTTQLFYLNLKDYLNSFINPIIP